MAALRCIPLAIRTAADQARLALLGQEVGELELIEIDGPQVGMAELYEAGVEIVGDEQSGSAPAIDRVDARARLRHDAGIGLSPAIEPARGRLGRLIRPQGDRTEAVLPERSVEACLPGRELTADFRAKVLHRF